MSDKISIATIVENMELQTDEDICVLNKKTMEIIHINESNYQRAEEGDDEGVYSDLDDFDRGEIERAADLIANEDDYVHLPSKFDIHEYQIMEDYCYTLDADLNAILLRAIKGGGAFRRFKNLIAEMDIEKDWYQYRDRRLHEIATDWCEEHQIPYITEKTE